MKLRLYMDVYDGFDFNAFTYLPMISINPPVKSDKITRLAFDLVIPAAVVDQIRGVDIHLPEPATTEIVK